MDLRRSARYLTRVLWSMIATAVVILALYVSLGRYYLPLVGRHSEWLLHQLAARTGLDIRADSLSGRWHGFSPTIAVSGLTIGSGSAGSIVTTQAAVDFNVPGSLAAGSLLVHSLSIDGLRIDLTQSPDGRWHIAGLPQGQASSGASRVLRLLQSAQGIDLTDAQLTMHTIGGRTVTLGPLGMHYHRNATAGKGTLTLGGNREAPPARIRIDTEGRWRDGNLEIQAALHMVGVDTEGIGPALDMPMVQRIAGLGGDLFVHYQQGAELKVYGKLRIEQLVGGNGKSGRPLLDNLQTSLRLIWSAQQAQVWFKDTSFRLDHSEWHIGHLTASYRAGNAAPLHLATDKLDIGKVKRAALAWLPSGLLAETLATLDPEGAVRNLHVDVPLRRENLPALQVRGILSGVSLRSWRGAPGAKGVSGVFTGGADRGTVDLDTSHLTLDFPAVYSEPLPFGHARGRVRWRIGSGEVRVNSGLLSVDGDFGAATALLDLDIPLHRQQGRHGQMSLLVGLRNSDAKYRNRFIPKLVSADLRQWLDHSIRSGHIPRAGFLYFGSLGGANPFSRSIGLYLDVTGGSIAYHPEWPALSNVNAWVVIDNEIVTAHADSAQVYNSRVKDANVRIKLDAGHLRLAVDGDLDGPSGDIVSLVTETPINRISPGVFDDWQMKGRYRGSMHLVTHFGGEHNQPPEVSAQVVLQGTTVTYRPMALNLEELTGQIAFDTTNGFRARDVHGRFLGRPLTLAAHSQWSTTGDRVTDVTAETQLRAEGLQRWTSLPEMAFLQGNAPLSAHVRIATHPEAPAEAELDLTTPLTGLAVDLPVPLGKPADQPRVLSLSMPLPSGPKRPAIVRWAQVGVGYFWLTAANSVSGRFVLGSQALQQQPVTHPGLEVTGEIARLDVQQWIPAAQKVAVDSGGSAVQGAWISGLRIGTLTAWGQQLSGPVVGLDTVDGRATISIEHPRVAGTIALGTGGEPLAVRLDRLELPLTTNGDVGDKLSGGGSDPLASMTPDSLIPLNVEVKHFGVNGSDWGHWQFRLRPLQDAVLIDGLKGQVGGITLTGYDVDEGATAWWQWHADGTCSTAFDGMLLAGDVGKVMELFSYQASVRSDKARFMATLRWPGSPAAISFEDLSGDIQVDMQDGRFLETSGAATGALKLFGVLNFNNLARRLRLDFSDLYKKGLSYDRVRGILLFEPGQLTVREPLVVKGPSVDFHLTGQLDLARELMDVQLVATLPITHSLPWVAALAGGPAVAAGVYVAGKMFEKQLDKLSSAVYEVEGPWNDPNIEFKQLFDIQGPSNQDSGNNKGGGDAGRGDPAQ